MHFSLYGNVNGQRPLTPSHLCLSTLLGFHGLGHHCRTENTQCPPSNDRSEVCWLVPTKPQSLVRPAIFKPVDASTQFASGCFPNILRAAENISSVHFTKKYSSRANQVKHSSIQTNSHGFLRDTKKEPSTRTPEPALSERDRGGDTGN